MEQVATVENLLPWVKGREIETKYGRRVLYVAAPTSEFLELHRANLEAFRKVGISLVQGPHGAVVHWWANPDDVELTTFSLTYVLERRDPLYDYQVDHTRTIIQSLRERKMALDGSDTGTGKTICATVAARELGLRPIVICKKSGLAVWRKWFSNLGTDAYLIVNYDKVRSGAKHCPFVGTTLNARESRRIQTMTPDSFLLEYLETSGRKITEVEKFDPAFLAYIKEKKEAMLAAPSAKDFAWKCPPDAILIFDEVHKCSGDDTVNCELLIAAKKSKTPLLMLSATIADSPIKMKALGLVLDLHKGGPDFKRWLMANGCRRMDYGWEFFGGTPTLQKLHRNVYPHRGSRMRKADIPGFPKCQIVAEAVDIEGMSASYEEHAEHFAKLRELKAESNFAITDLLRELQWTETLKIPFLVAEAKDLVLEGKSVVIATRFDYTREALMKQLKTRCGVYGTQKEGDREKCIEAFQADKEHIIIVNMQAGSDSISLNDVNGIRSREGLVCPTFSAVDLIQFFGRLNRADDKSCATYRMIFAAGTPEEKACLAVQEKVKNIALLNDGDLRAGIDFMRNHKSKNE